MNTEETTNVSEEFKIGLREGRKQALEEVDKSIKRLQENWFNEGRKQTLEEVEKILEDWDVEPCCHGIQADTLLRKLKEMEK